MGTPGESDDNRATELVQNILSKKEIADIDFDIAGIFVSPTMYKTVSKAITDKNIVVMVAPTLIEKEAQAKYVAELKFANGNIFYNLLLFRTADLGTTPHDILVTEAGIVHECLHAAFDALKVKGMNHALDEAAAYTAGAIYGISRLLNAGGHPDKIPWTNAIQIAAYDFAFYILKAKNDASNRFYSSPDFAVRYANKANVLITAIMNDPGYSKVAKDPAINAGVGRPWKLTATQAGSNQTR
jgi:hypothetical protein